MQVTIIGPNLQDQSKGTFHVHAAGCADIARNVRRDPAFADGWTIEAVSRFDVMEAIYGDFEDFEDNPSAFDGDCHYAPCTSRLA